MYRDTLIGMAVSATLGEMGDALTEGQRESLWKVFDSTMDKCLAEAPMMSRVVVRAPAATQGVPASTARPQQSQMLITDPAVEDDLEGPAPEVPEGVGREVASCSEGPEGHNQSVPASISDGMAFPVYRCVDGVWTILLKNPTVEVRDHFGAEESLQLDYLKVYLKHAAPNTAGGGNRKQKARKSAR